MLLNGEVVYACLTLAIGELITEVWIPPLAQEARDVLAEPAGTRRGQSKENVSRAACPDHPHPGGLAAMSASQSRR
jgi:hypothetical protein